MKLGELKRVIADISAEHDDVEVIVAADEEGNDYNPLYGIFIEPGVRDDSYRAGLHPVHEEDVKSGYYDEDELITVAVIG